MIKKLHEGGRKLGIIDTPMLYEENIRNTMVYKMYTCDLFNFLHEYCNINKSRGVSEDVAKVWIAQLLVAVDAMAEKGMAHRDLKVRLSEERRTGGAKRRPYTTAAQ